jgi:hypothetical protein
LQFFYIFQGHDWHKIILLIYKVGVIQPNTI